MKILLLDADSTIPNIPLMKIYAYYKKHEITYRHLNLSFYQIKKRRSIKIDTKDYDLTFCSVIFNDNAERIKGDIIFGGTGYDLSTVLPKEIEDTSPDYSLYPNNKTSYGFLSRGCIRKCKFCVVPQKEGKIRQVATIDEVVRHKKVKFLDNNFLALPNHKELLEELVKKRIRCEFNQGLDIRLLDEDNGLLLGMLDYTNSYYFAFDDYIEDVVENNLEYIRWRKPWQVRLFIYTHPNIPFEDILKRAYFAKERKCLIYISRDISCYSTPIYQSLARWANYPKYFISLSFEDYLNCFKNNEKNVKKLN